jgi:hypothetical protein
MSKGGKLKIEDGKQIITHRGKEYELISAGYRWIMHKWSFVIAGVDSEIRHGQEIEFLGTTMTVTFTVRRDKSAAYVGKHSTETFLEAWIL